MPTEVVYIIIGANGRIIVKAKSLEGAIGEFKEELGKKCVGNGVIQQ